MLMVLVSTPITHWSIVHHTLPSSHCLDCVIATTHSSFCHHAESPYGHCSLLPWDFASLSPVELLGSLSSVTQPSFQSIVRSKAGKMDPRVNHLWHKHDDLNWEPKTHKKAGNRSSLCNPSMPSGRWRMKTGEWLPPWDQLFWCAHQWNTRDLVSNKAEGQNWHSHCLWVPYTHHGVYMITFIHTQTHKTSLFTMANIECLLLM